jgi:hypothetical protein
MINKLKKLEFLQNIRFSASEACFMKEAKLVLIKTVFIWTEAEPFKHFQ